LIAKYQTSRPAFAGRLIFDDIGWQILCLSLKGIQDVRAGGGPYAIVAGDVA